MLQQRTLGGIELNLEFCQQKEIPVLMGSAYRGLVIHQFIFHAIVNISYVHICMYIL